MRSVIVVLLTVFSHVLLPKEEEKSALSLFATNVWLDVFLNLSTIDIWGRTILCFVLGILGRLVVHVASNGWIPVVPFPPAVTIKNVSRHCPRSPVGQNDTQLRTIEAALVPHRDS